MQSVLTPLLPACCRDYRKYVTATPAPHDLREVEFELQEVMELQRRKMRDDQTRHDQVRRRLDLSSIDIRIIAVSNMAIVLSACVGIPTRQHRRFLALRA